MPVGIGRERVTDAASRPRAGDARGVRASRRVGVRAWDPWLLLLAAAAAAQLALLAHWAHQLGPSYSEDFDAHYAAAKLLLGGHSDSMYSLPAQVSTLSAAGGPHIGTVNHAGWGPVGLLTVLPFAALWSLPTAVALWTVLQVVALGAAALLVVRGGRGLGHVDRLVVLGAMLSAPGLGQLVVLGQWEGLAAVLLALLWLDVWRGSRWRAALWTALLAAALPQFAVGVAVFQVARWGWAQLGRLTALAGAVGAGSLALLGTTGFAGWLGQVVDLGREVRGQSTDGLFGLVSSVLGSGAVGLAVTAVAVIAGAVVCWRLGRRSRGGVVSAGLALGVTGLSLLLSPHLFHYGLATLVPVALLALLAERRTTWRTPTLLVLWTALSVLTVAELRTGSSANALVPALLIALVVAASATRTEPMAT